ncbi:uncharacterized protein LOC62_04G005400 [Vanrija pseudolonga]|uniref:Uncharacterized protein n=1 Tax=Vanrija pseudolonga TaxID=143232 RepID=A0AAF1BMB9_9TREE|nr:hypothetical protein LOC62_04G005400 [Vanrija pseudolonga]
MVDDGPLFVRDGSADDHSPYIRDAPTQTLDEASGEQSILEPTDQRPRGDATQWPLHRVSNVKGSLAQNPTTPPALRLASLISIDEDQVTAVPEIDSLLSPAPVQTERLGDQVAPLSKEEEANINPADPNNTGAIERLDVGGSSSLPQESAPMQYLRAQDGVAVTEILPPEYDPQWKGPLASGTAGEGDGRRS